MRLPDHPLLDHPVRLVFLAVLFVAFFGVLLPLWLRSLRPPTIELVRDDWVCTAWQTQLVPRWTGKTTTLDPQQVCMAYERKVSPR